MSLPAQGVCQPDHVHGKEERIQNNPEPIVAQVAGDDQCRTPHHVRQVGQHQVRMWSKQGQRARCHHTTQSTHELKPENYWIVLEVVYPVIKDALKN